MYKVSILWKELRDFLLLWLTQSLSGLGSAMTSYALIVWSYQQEGSALSTALLSICSYAPYVVMSIFAGALSDRWNKKRTLLWCDSFAAATTVAVLLMLRLGTLRLEYLYLINALNGLMNTIQQPGRRCGEYPADAEKALPAGQRPALPLILGTKSAYARARHGAIGFRRAGSGACGGPGHLCLGLRHAAGMHPHPAHAQ